VLHEKARALKAAGKTREAEDALLEALRHDPENVAAKDELRTVMAATARAPGETSGTGPTNEAVSRPATAREQVKTTEHHGKTAESLAGDAAKGEAARGFDTPGLDKGEVPVVQLDGMRVEIPPAVRNDPEVIKHQATIARQDAEIDALEVKLQEVKTKREDASGRKRQQLALDESRIKDQLSRAEYDRGLAQKALDARISKAVGKDWKSKAKPAAETTSTQTGQAPATESNP
jgi:hypothetical protein